MAMMQVTPEWFVHSSVVPVVRKSGSGVVTAAVYNDRTEEVQQFTVPQCVLAGMPMTPFLPVAGAAGDAGLVALNKTLVVSYEVALAEPGVITVDFGGCHPDVQLVNDAGGVVLRQLDEAFHATPVLQLGDDGPARLYITQELTEVQLVGVCRNVVVVDLSDTHGTFHNIVVPGATFGDALQAVRPLMRK